MEGRYKWIDSVRFVSIMLVVRPLITGGKISFYIYASHVLVIYSFGYYFIDFLRCYISFKTAFFVTFAATAVLIYGISYFLFQIIEQKILYSLFLKVFGSREVRYV